jgi:mannose-6-phosphate isomerase-like protein (cupin superfamily)
MRPKFKKYNLKNIPTEKFTMTPLELKDYIDFEIKRVYFITEPKADAGGHCHRQENELFFLVQGRCTAVIDQGGGPEEHRLESGKHAIYVGAYVWHYFKDFSPNAILLALSSTNYNPDRSDYIEAYEKFQKSIKK